MLRIEMFGDTIDRLTIIDPITGETLREMPRTQVFPATHYVAGDERMATAMVKIEAELQERLPGSRRRASCSRRSACGCAPSTTSR